MELKSYCFPLKEPNPLILEIFLVSKSEKVKCSRMYSNLILLLVKVIYSSSFFLPIFVFDQTSHRESLTFPREYQMLIFGGTLPHKLPPRQNRRPVEKVLFPSRKNPLNFGRLSHKGTILSMIFLDFLIGVSD